MVDADAEGMGLSEDALIARYFRPLAEGFPGAFGLQDDAAVLDPAAGEDLVITTDALIAGVHFLTDDMPADIAYKALAVNVSDLAAKAAKPIAYSLALALPRGTPESWIAEFADGLGQAQAAFGIALSGGDTATSPGGPLMISITAFGRVPHGRMVAAQRRAAGRQPLCQRHHRRCRIGPASAARRCRDAPLAFRCGGARCIDQPLFAARTAHPLREALLAMRVCRDGHLGWARHRRDATMCGLRRLGTHRDRQSAAIRSGAIRAAGRSRRPRNDPDRRR